MRTASTHFIRAIGIVLLSMLMLPLVSFAQNNDTKAVEVTAPGNRQLRLAVEIPRGA